MIFIIIGIIGSIYFTFGLLKDAFDISTAIMGLIMEMIYLFTGTFFGLCIAIVVGQANQDNMPYICDIESTTELVALKDNSKIHGHIGGAIFIFSGYVNESMHYNYMQKYSDGSLKMASVPSHRAYIYEQDNVKPRIEFIKCEPEKFITKWGVYDVKRPFPKIYVPKSTVSNDFSINLQ